MKPWKVTLAQEDDGRLRMHYVTVSADTQQGAYNAAAEHFPMNGHWYIIEVEEKRNET